MSTLPQPAHTWILSRAAAPRPENSVERFGARLEAHRFAALALFSAVYFAGAVLHARAKPFWNDEIYTVLISGLPDLHSVWRALSQGLDGHPPLAYLPVRMARVLPLDLHIAARVPAMIGFWAFCLCLFRFVRRRLGIWPAFAALLLPFATGAWQYSVEARPYGQVLGFTGAALAAWQMAAAGDAPWARRRWTVPALAISLAGVAASHFEAALVFGPFCGAELVRDFRRRKIDWPIWIAFLCGLLAVLSNVPLIGAQRQYMAHAWSYPSATKLLEFYEGEFRGLILPAMVFLVLAAAYLLFGDRVAYNGSPSRERRLHDHEIAVAVFFLLLPLAGLAAGFLLTHMFVDRYVISAAAGVILLAVVMVQRASRPSPPVLPALLALAALFPFAYRVARPGRFHNPIDEAPLLREAIERGPVAIADGLLFSQAWYYLPAQLKPRVFYPVDVSAAATFTRGDTFDRLLLAWRSWIKISAPDFDAIARPGRSILIYYNPQSPWWLVTRLEREGAHLDVVAWDPNAAILRATLPGVPGASGEPK